MTRAVPKVKRKGKSPTRKLDDYLLSLWRVIVKLRAGYKCEYCGSTKNLNSHHVFSSTNYALRYDVDNGVCLCVNHHVYGKEATHNSPVVFAFTLEKRGQQWYDDLLATSREHTGKKVDKEAVKEILEQIKKNEELQNKV